MLSAGDHRGFEAFITHQNGTRYAEHEVEEAPLSTMCYLQSQEGKVFRIHLRATGIVKKLHPKHDWIVAYRVDGRLIHQLAIRKGAFHEVCSELHSEKEEKIYQGRLTFSNVPTTDDAREVTLDEGAIEGLGEIRIDVYDGKYGKETVWGEPVLAKADVGVAAEAQAKRIGCTSVTSKTPWVYEPDAKEVQFHYNNSSAPFYSFVFLYRTKTALEILKIIEFDRDALEEEPATIGNKRKRTAEASGVPDDVPVFVNSSDSEHENSDTPSTDSGYDREELARENAELRRQLRIANMRNPKVKGTVADAVDLTGVDSEDE